MGLNVAQKLIRSHLADGEMTPGTEIGLRIDQTLTQDATGTMVMLELEALALDRVRTEVSVQNLANFGVLAAEFTDPADYDRIDEGDELRVDGLPDALGSADGFTVRNETKDQDYAVRHRLSARQVEMVRAGGQIPLVRGRTST